MFTRMGSTAFKKDLTNIRLLCQKLDNPHHHFKSIHIAGTNGKGSVSHMLASILQTSGLKTGLYTSPHLYDFRERIRVNGIMCDEDFVISFTEKIKPLIEEIEPSFFEITVAMAFEYFRVQQVDIAVVEVGLGGRLDSTNIIEPILSVITNIGKDHTNMLGETMEEIATEKAGIIKHETPVVVGEKTDVTADVFEQTAASHNAPIFFASDQFSLLAHHWTASHLHVVLRDETSEETLSLSTDLPGIYQLKNICTVMAAIKAVNATKKLPFISTANIQEGLLKVKQHTGLHGRWEVVREKPTVVLEVAHNREGIVMMLQHIALLSFRQLHIVIGMVRDKDVDAVLELLPSSARYYFTQAQIPRALEADALKEKAAKHSLIGNAYHHVNEALQVAVSNASDEDLIVVCGSIFVVAEVEKN